MELAYTYRLVRPKEANDDDIAPFLSIIDSNENPYNPQISQVRYNLKVEMYKLY